MKMDSPSIAIVDDEKDFVNLLEMLFSKRGIPISFIAYDGLDAIDQYNKAERKPDIILIDHHMRVVNGVDATKQILSNNGKTKFIFLSADRQVKNEALEAGAVEFLHKPTGINEIVDTILKYGKY
jgi:two-component system chemotaxis response regulator CheY